MISKRKDKYLRRLLVSGAHSVIQNALEPGAWVADIHSFQAAFSGKSAVNQPCFVCKAPAICHKFITRLSSQSDLAVWLKTCVQESNRLTAYLFHFSRTDKNTGRCCSGRSAEKFKRKTKIFPVNSPFNPLSYCLPYG